MYPTIDYQTSIIVLKSPWLVWPHLEPALKLGARFVHGLVALEQLDDEDGEVLVRAGAHGHRDGAHAGGAGQVHLGEGETPSLPHTKFSPSLLFLLFFRQIF